MSQYNFADFTIDNYRRLLQRAKQTHRFIKFEEALINTHDPVILWRHDVDVSVHRAHLLAQIEADLNVSATYFIQLTSEFYNVYESEIQRRIRAIKDAGHSIGVHFDYSAYPQNGEASFKKWLTLEKETFENLFEIEIKAFSLHTPTALKEPVSEFKYAGMCNAYASEITSRYKYCSDSNGYWRHQRLDDFLESEGGARSNLHVLTHPEYWSDEILSPRERIQRCIEGRAKSTFNRFYSIVSRTGRIVPGREDEGQP